MVAFSGKFDPDLFEKIIDLLNDLFKKFYL